MKKQNQQAQEFLNIEDISGSLLWTTDKNLIGFLALTGSDNSLLQEEENRVLADRMATALSEETEPWQLISVPRTVDTRQMMENLSAMRLETTNDARLKLLTGEISALHEMEDSGVKEPMIILKLWTRAALGADKELLRRLSLMASRLNDSQISTRILDDGQIKFLCRVYAELGVFQEDTGEEEDITLLAGRKRTLRERKAEAAEKRAALLDPLTPVGGFFFESNRARIGSAVLRCYGVTKYPAQVPYGWAVSLTSATDAVTCLTYYPGQSADLGNTLSRGAKRAARDATSASDLRQRKQLERQVQGADEMLEAMDSQGLCIGHISIVAMVIGKDDTQLEQNCQRAITRFSAKRMTLKSLANVQKAAFQHLSPYYTARDLIGQMTRHIIPLVTLAGGYPATVSTIRDNNGVYFARTMDNGIMSLDLLTRDVDRTNGNGIIIGTTGIGKSTTVKHIVQSMYMRGAKVIVFDPEREFKAMCRLLGGSWWDAGGGLAKCNPLQVRNLPLQEQEEGKAQLSPLAQHMQTLYVILRYKLQGLTEYEFELLKRVLRLVYEEFGFTMEQQVFSQDPSKYPLFSDVYRWLLEHEGEELEYKNLALFLEDMSVGAESQLWNGPTDIALGNSLVVIDTHSLVNAPQSTRAAQYYNLLLMAFSEASKDRTTPYLIVADEAHLLFDPTVPEAAGIVKQIVKRIRKYEGCLWLVSQSLSDMLHEAVSLNGQAVVDNSAYKILMGCDGQNLADTVRLFNLTAAEENLLEARQRGVALCLIGNKHIKARFELSPYKLELMGSAGGR